MYYRSLFFMGLIWFVLGITTDIIVFFVLGLAYIVTALANKHKLEKNIKPVPDQQKKILYALIALTVLAVLIAFFARIGCYRGISNFEQCTAAGNPVMESYPRQCRACGRTFVEEIG